MNRSFGGNNVNLSHFNIPFFHIKKNNLNMFNILLTNNYLKKINANDNITNHSSRLLQNSCIYLTSTYMRHIITNIITALISTDLHLIQFQHVYTCQFLDYILNSFSIAIIISKYAASQTNMPSYPPGTVDHSEFHSWEINDALAGR